MTGLNQTARCVISFNQEDEIELYPPTLLLETLLSWSVHSVTLDEKQVEFVEVDDIPGEVVEPPASGVVVIVWDDQDVLRCVTADGDVTLLPCACITQR